MKQLNLLLSLYSLTAFVIIVERLSPTTKLFLQPFSFTSLHEINQTYIFLPITIVISFFVLRLLTNNFKLLQKKTNAFLAMLFVVGIYYYGAGEGWHELAGSTMNQHCKDVSNFLCSGLFFNFYYAGNLAFFLGGIVSIIVLLLFAAQHASEKFTNKDLTILITNSLIYGFSWFAYAAFDKVLIGLISSGILLLVSLYFLVKIKGNIRKYPYIFSAVIAYSFATIGALIVRLI